MDPSRPRICSLGAHTASILSVRDNGALRVASVNAARGELDGVEDGVAMCYVFTVSAFG